MMTSTRPSPSSQVNGGEWGDCPISHWAPPTSHYLTDSSAHTGLLPAEISLDVDADRDGEVEKNNPKKVSGLLGYSCPDSDMGGPPGHCKNCTVHSGRAVYQSGQLPSHKAGG